MNPCVSSKDKKWLQQHSFFCSVVGGFTGAKVPHNDYSSRRLCVPINVSFKEVLYKRWNKVEYSRRNPIQTAVHTGIFVRPETFKTSLEWSQVSSVRVLTQTGLKVLVQVFLSGIDHSLRKNSERIVRHSRCPGGTMVENQS